MTRGRCRPGWSDAAAARPPRQAALLVSADISKSQALAITEWTREPPGGAARETIRSWCRPRPRAPPWMTFGSRPRCGAEWRPSAAGRLRVRVDDRTVAGRDHVRGAGSSAEPDPGRRRAGRLVLGGRSAKSRAGGHLGGSDRGPRFHDALLAGCELLIGREDGAGPVRRGHPCGVHIPFPHLRSIPSPVQEEVWLRGAAASRGTYREYAAAAACDASRCRGDRARGPADIGQ